MKHPRWRVADFALMQSDTIDLLQTVLEAAIMVSPIKALVLDLEVTGSYARGTAQLHSDVDINISTGDNFNKVGDLLRGDLAKSKAFHQGMVDARHLAGIFIDFGFEHPKAKDIEVKQVYSLRERQWYRRDVNQTYPRFKLTQAKEWFELPPKPAGIYNKPGEGSAIQPDEYADDIKTWAALYGEAYQKFGSTPDTAWVKDWHG